MDDNSRSNCQNSKRNFEKKGCLLDHLDITVSEAEKRANGALNIREYFTVYLVETKVKDENFKQVATKLGIIWRRYTEFEQLRQYLEVTYPYLVLPPLPEKRMMYTWQKSSADTLDPDFVDRRRSGLENFLNRVARHPLLCYDALFIGFLQQEEGWHQSCKETGYLQLAESKLKSLTTLPARVKRSDERFDAMQDYANELQAHLNNLLRTRAKLAERLYAVYKLHANYGRVFSEWSVVEKTMGDGLQKAGHYLDSIAASIDALLEEEELVADQLKEYLFFAASLQAVCRRHEMLQIQLERAEETVNSKNQEKELVERGKSSLMSRLFGSVDTDEIKEMKMSALKTKIVECNNSLRCAQEELNDFTNEALTDFERFQKQKTVDMKQTLSNYVAVQMKMARQGLQAWSHIKECLEAIP